MHLPLPLLVPPAAAAGPAARRPLLLPLLLPPLARGRRPPAHVGHAAVTRPRGGLLQQAGCVFAPLEPASKPENGNVFGPCVGRRCLAHDLSIVERKVILRIIFIMTTGDIFLTHARSIVDRLNAQLGVAARPVGVVQQRLLAEGRAHLPRPRFRAMALWRG
jgi:hypothetical protein